MAIKRYGSRILFGQIKPNATTQYRNEELMSTRYCSVKMIELTFHPHSSTIREKHNSAYALQRYIELQRVKVNQDDIMGNEIDKIEAKRNESIQTAACREVWEYSSSRSTSLHTQHVTMARKGVLEYSSHVHMCVQSIYFILYFTLLLLRFIRT